MKLTSTTIRAFTLPPGMKDKTYFDPDLGGFGVRVRKSGLKTFIVMYDVNGKTRRMTLGSVTAVDLGKARSMAKDLLAAVRLGQDPAQEKAKSRAKSAETFGALLPRYLAGKCVTMRPRSFAEVERHLRIKAKSLHARPVTAIDPRTIAILVGQVTAANGPAAARCMRASLSGYLSWLCREGLVNTNPVANTNKPAEAGPRDRVLDTDELRKIWRELGTDHFGAIVKLLLLTATRRDEIGDLRWSEIDFDKSVITLPAGRVKNRRNHEIPMSHAVTAILQAQPRRLSPDGLPRDLVFGISAENGFSGWAAAKTALDARIAVRGAIPKWTLHDLRRSAATGMAESNVQPHVIESILNHQSGHKAGVAGVYNRASYSNEKRAALMMWAEHVLAIAEGRKSKIVTLPQRA